MVEETVFWFVMLNFHQPRSNTRFLMTDVGFKHYMDQESPSLVKQEHLIRNWTQQMRWGKKFRTHEEASEAAGMVFMSEPVTFEEAAVYLP